MEYIRDQLAFLRMQAEKLYEMFLPEEVFYDAVAHPIGFDEYFGPSPEPDTPRVDPRNWDLYWVSQTDGPLDELPPHPELQDFPKEHQPQGLLDIPAKEDHLKSSIRAVSIIRDEPELSKDEPEPKKYEPEPKKYEPEPKKYEQEPKKGVAPEASEDQSETIAKDRPDAAAEDLKNSITKLKTEVEAVTDPPRPQSPGFLANLWAFLTTHLPSIKLPKLKLKVPEVKLGTVTAPQSVAETVTKKPEPLHYSRTPLATYARVKSRLQDRPPLVAAFADQVSVLNPAAMVPKQASEQDKPMHSSTGWDKLMHNLGYLLPTPLAALVHTHKNPRRRSLASILGARTTRKVVAEVEHDPLDDSMIPQYRKWKKIKNKRLHNAQWACLITVCILLICAVHIQRLREIKWWKFEFWQWLALGFVALAGRLISGWGIKLLEISIELNLLLKKRILYFVFGLRRSMKNIMWLGLILITWTVVVLHVEDVSDTIPTITKLLQCGFTGSILWVLKVLLVKILTDAFHRDAYFDRIQDTLFHQYVLEILSEPRSHRYTPSSGKGTDGRRRHAPVFKLRVAPSQNLARREAKTQGRIERQYSPTPLTGVKKLESRTPTRATYSKTTLNPSDGNNFWANLKLRPLFPSANFLTPTTSSSTPSSPKVLRTAMTPFDAAEAALISSGTPSAMRGGLDPADPLENKPSLTIASPVDNHSRLKVKFQDIVLEEQNPNQVVVEAVEDMEAAAVVKVLEAAEDVEAVQASSPLAGVEVLEEVVIREPGITSQADSEVIQPGVSLQEKEFQSEIDVPKKEEVQAETGLAPEPEVVATEAVPEPMSSAGPSEPVAVASEPVAAPTKPGSKPPIFVAPEIELEDESGHEHHTTVAQDKIQILTKDSVSAWTLMRLMKVVRTRNLHMYSKSSLMEPDWEIDSIPMATKAAKYIFKNVAHKGQQELLLKNFMRFFPPDKATQAFSSFEVTLNGTITKQGLLKWVLDVYKERKSLSLTLNDNRSVIYQINLLLDGVLIAVILAISFLIMSVNNQALLAVTTMLLMPGVSIFGNLFRNTFESLLFLFIVHPFDVGDRVFIEGVPLMVEEMKIMSTVFLNNSSEHITYPNFVLINKPIANIHRSPDQWDAIEFQILANTSLEKLSILRNRIDQYVHALPQIWYPRWRLIVRDIENTNKLRLLMTIQHHINFQDAGERTQRRGDMILHIQGLMLDLAIGYQLPPGQALASKWP